MFCIRFKWYFTDNTLPSVCREDKKFVWYHLALKINFKLIAELSSYNVDAAGSMFYHSKVSTTKASSNSKVANVMVIFLQYTS